MLVFIARRGVSYDHSGMVSASQTVCTKQDYETGELVSGLAETFNDERSPGRSKPKASWLLAKPSLPASRRHGP